MWRSSRVKRACSSTLGAESQGALDAIRHMEWLGTLLGEALHQNFSVEHREQWLPSLLSCLMTDCKSLFDTVSTQTSSAGQDKGANLDIVVLRQHLKRTGTPLRWCPTERMLADSMTKNTAESADLLRSVLREGVYTLAQEEAVMKLKAEERLRRVERGKARALSSQQQSKDSAASGGSRGGQRDFWLPAQTRHYYRRIAGAKVSDEDKILKVRCHQQPRRRTMSRSELPASIADLCESQCLVLLRRAESGGKGVLEEKWANLDEPEELEFEWTGATVLLRPPDEE